MSCPWCGTANDDGARFCRRCGTPLGGAATTTAVIDPVVASGDDDDATDPGGAADDRSAAVAEPLRTCPDCQASNSPRRVLCGRCGADLDTGERAGAVARPTRGIGGAGEPDDPGSGAVGRTIVAIVTAGLILGAGLGAMVALGIGPFASDEGPPPAVFDASAYAGAPGGLDTLGVSVGTSTTHEPAGEVTFGAQLMIDGDPATAWNSSGETNPDGVGEQIRIEFPEPVWLTQLVFSNGDGRDDARYFGNARVRRARVVLDAGVSFTVLLLDQPGPQVVPLDVPELTTGMRIEVLDVYPGDTYDDLAISEIGFGGYLATDADATVAQERARFPRVVPTGS